MKHLAEKFSVLNPDLLAQSKEQQVLQKAEALQREYEDDLSPAFPMQMVCFRAFNAGRNCKAPQHNLDVTSNMLCQSFKMVKSESRFYHQ